MTTELKYTLIFYGIFLISGYLFRKVKANDEAVIDDTLSSNRMAHYLGMIIMISFACAVTMTVITIMKFFN
ncbi:MAG: hypothetical protein ISQ22_05730 [Rhizobiales bacterium]|nr:hypothetical protein [Rhodobiaceae bacterium]MBL6623408.1 hypothetical protein [Hyphomicrobiales bacterium]MBL6770849.1 hypothetical protein [Hyphomicrobiales bacterium]RPF97824.1 MAG: hypothetical protein CBD87_001155 [Rhizobiales bacterium TMED227]|tara:strand:+ start:40137 stop:40349 length:213 start_codon:yes stop_codon:yes gene_type:complete